jgi:hypothetical protein
MHARAGEDRPQHMDIRSERCGVGGGSLASTALI